jgi:hypothetical protein
VEIGNGTVTLSFSAAVIADGWWVASIPTSGPAPIYHVEAAWLVGDAGMPGGGKWRTVATSGARWTWGGGLIPCPGCSRPPPEYLANGLQEIELLVGLHQARASLEEHKKRA